MKKTHKIGSYWASSFALLMGLAPLPFLMGLAPQPGLNALREHSPKSSSQLKATARLKLSSSYGKLPLAFEPNQGQTDSQVQFLSHGNGYTLFLTSEEAVLVLQKPQANSQSKFLKLKNGKKRGKLNPPSAPISQTPPVALHMKLEDAQTGVSFVSQEQLPGISNYLIGNDRSKWHTRIPQYAKVQAQAVYPGIDMVYYGNQGHLEYDFVIKPGADPNSIHLKYEGAKSAKVNGQGDLEMQTEDGKVIFRSPTVYQESEGQRNPVEGHYRMADDNGIRFEVKDYDKTKALIIDPALDYSTVFGGDAIAVDENGNAYVTGATTVNYFPTTSGAFQTSFPSSTYSAFVFELNPAGSDLIYCTYLGGDGEYAGDYGYGIAVDGNGDAYVTGITGSDNFPTSAGALQTSLPNTYQSAFMTELNPMGTGLVYSTYLGGNNDDQGNGIAVDGSGNAYLTGYTLSTNFPTTSGAYQTAIPGWENAFVTKLYPLASGSAQLVYSTYLGGDGHNAADSGNGITVDGKGDAYVTGSTGSDNFPTSAGALLTNLPTSLPTTESSAFVTELNPAGSGLVYSTYLGGDGVYDGDMGIGIAVDGKSDAYVTGITGSDNFPISPGASQANFPNYNDTVFVTELNPTGTGLVYSTFLGGNAYEEGYGITVDGTGDAYVTGTTWSTNFPLTSDALQTTHTNVTDLIFLTELNLDGTALVFSTYFGGESLYDGSYGESIAMDNNGNIYLAGSNLSSDFPTTAGAYQAPCSFCGDGAFVAKFDASDFSGFTPVSTATPSFTATTTPTSSPMSSASFTPTPTTTLTSTSTATVTPPVTATPSFSPTPSASFTPTSTPTFSPTSSSSFTPTNTLTGTLPPTNSPTWTLTPANSPTATTTPTLTNPPVNTATPTYTCTVTFSFTPTVTNLNTFTPTPGPVTVVVGSVYPNPIQDLSPVSVHIQAPLGSTVEWSVFTMVYRKVLDNTYPITGNSTTLVWHLDDNGGNRVANGLYYLKVRVNGINPYTKVMKVLVLR